MIVKQAQGRSAETAVSPHHNNQSTTYNLASRLAHRKVSNYNKECKNWFMPQTEYKPTKLDSKQSNLVTAGDHGAWPLTLWSKQSKAVPLP
jgi:hypothetical protein